MESVSISVSSILLRRLTRTILLRLLVFQDEHLKDMEVTRPLSEDEINRLIEESREELAAVGENPDDYFKTVQTTRFMM